MCAGMPEGLVASKWLPERQVCSQRFSKIARRSRSSLCKILIGFIILLPPRLRLNLFRQIIPFVHFILCEFYRMNVIVVFNKAATNCFFKRELKNNVTKKGKYSLCSLFVVLAYRCCGQPKSIIEKSRKVGSKTRTPQIVYFICNEKFSYNQNLRYRI